ncbi:MAG TPA: TRAP transporter substrate-binding protein [Xanthobacteraceae bacterium]|jgi:TRAP-type C4-dicarboxylate transport system substrate-binding protein|nr:TRAP transporter substrate-binding protein [Xanthobacteraceae bacterium]
MHSGNRAIFARAAGAAGALVLALMLTFGAAQAQDKTYVMKITLPTINDAPHQFAKDFAALVEKDSGGRIKGEVYPASQLGSIPRQIEGVQFGAIQAATVPPEFFVGVDERFEVMAAPGLVDSIEHGQRVAADPAVRKLMLGLGANKGLHGVGLYIAQPSCIIAKIPIRHLADFKGKKIRIFASQFQSTAFDRLGSTPVAMTLGDVLPALQQGAIDGSVAGIGPFVHLHFVDAAKYVTETNQPAIFLILEVSQKWYDSLPKDLQEIVDRDGAAVSKSIEPVAVKMYQEQRKAWTDAGGELISLPRDEQAEMMRMLSSVGDDVSKTKPALRDAYEIVADAAKRTRQAPSQ